MYLPLDGARGVGVYSLNGSLQIRGSLPEHYRTGRKPTEWGGKTTPTKDIVPDTIERPQFVFGSDQNSWWSHFPHYLPVAVTGMLSVTIGYFIPCRFSLRTMLVVTTLVAPILGAAVWMVR